MASIAQNPDGATGQSGEVAVSDIAGVDWLQETHHVPYTRALEAMETRNAQIHSGEAAELVWLLEHPPVYTAGTSADPAELLNPQFDVVKAGRGGRYTYHGPGQRVGYLMLDLARRGKDVRCFVHAIEGWVIATLADFGVESWRADGRVGIWTKDIDGREAKIGAIGVRVRRWVTMHGFSVNLDPDLSHFGGIVPCGIDEFGVTSMARLGKPLTNAEWDAALKANFDSFLDALGGDARKTCAS
ncbi:MAG: lipoyl(octanoyl) transferase LipB [Pseudomonadota bacterium]